MALLLEVSFLAQRLPFLFSDEDAIHAIDAHIPVRNGLQIRTVTSAQESLRTSAVAAAIALVYG